MTELKDTLAALSEAAGEAPTPSNAWGDFSIALASAYRSGQLVLAPTVEVVARALQAEDEHHWNRPDCIEHWREYATAVIAAMTMSGDGKP